MISVVPSCHGHLLGSSWGVSDHASQASAKFGCEKFIEKIILQTVPATVMEIGAFNHFLFVLNWNNSSLPMFQT